MGRARDMGAIHPSEVKRMLHDILWNGLRKDLKDASPVNMLILVVGTEQVGCSLLVLHLVVKSMSVVSCHRILPSV
jgi:hypothetical protein